ncbi:NAD(P)/FAD-dependent oxidoreductase [Rhizobium leguminosarum]|uniref:NAD(P)-binding domain-containing protein n=1 Tax=Rhizobium leguminosarum TaxID=384 RepID=UPI001C9156FA|nr:NAD(P)-binding domain-containing protein [Rhizobium leguminosarum]MBY3030579.1 NAD(P)/FAD-dependent oxidoreductase [Rhizobium leguminosarum]
MGRSLYLILNRGLVVFGSFERSTIRDETSKSALIFTTSSLLKFPDTLTETYLQEFVAQQSMTIEFGVDVDRISVVSGNYHLSTNKGAVAARNLFIATGRDRKPIIPAWAGLEHFRGEVIHAAEFGSPQEYDGKRVLVVGSGNSGFDILNHLAKQKPSALWLSSRHGPTLVPKRLFGVTVHRLSPLLACLPTRLADAALAATSYMAFGDLRRFGIGNPTAGGASRLKDGTALASDDGAVRAIKAGTIKVMPELQSFDEDQVHFRDGKLVRQTSLLQRLVTLLISKGSSAISIC